MKNVGKWVPSSFLVLPPSFPAQTLFTSLLLPLSWADPDHILKDNQGTGHWNRSPKASEKLWFIFVKDMGHYWVAQSGALKQPVEYLPSVLAGEAFGMVYEFQKSLPEYVDSTQKG